MDLLAFLRTQVHANRLSNHRLHGAMRALSDADYRAPRASFFPSLAATLEHILAVDLYYIAALEGDAAMEQAWRDAPQGVALDVLHAAQARADQRFIDHVGALSPAALDDVVADRGAPDPARAARMIAHCSSTRCTTRPGARCSPAPRSRRRSSTSS